MELSHRNENSVCIVTVVGEIFPETENFRKYLNPLLADTNLKAVLVNLEKVPFIGSTTVGILIEAHQALQNRQAHFALCHLNATVQKILQFTQIDAILNTYPTESKALAYLERKPTAQK